MPMSQGNAVAIAGLNAKTALLNAGAGPAVMRIYSGPVPPLVDDALSGNTQLAQLDMSDPAFAAAVDASPGARADANAIAADVSADNTGTASFYRLFDSNLVPRFQGTCGLAGSGEPLELNTLAFVAGAQIQVLSLSIVEPEG